MEYVHSSSNNSTPLRSSVGKVSNEQVGSGDVQSAGDRTGWAGGAGLDRIGGGVQGRGTDEVAATVIQACDWLDRACKEGVDKQLRLPIHASRYPGNWIYSC